MSRVRSYRRHKPSGQAVVTLNGKDHYLGPWRSRLSRMEYDRLTSEWLANGRYVRNPGASTDSTITELIALYWRFAERYYVKNGQPTKKLAAIRDTVKPLKRLYGQQLVRDFGPLKLKTIRQAMIDAHPCRGTVNDRIGRIKRMFKWATENELVPPDVFHGLQAVSGLRRGRSARSGHQGPQRAGPQSRRSHQRPPAHPDEGLRRS
jgi:hypothetical protein